MVRSPRPRQARWMRRAISPRLAIRTELNIVAHADPQQRLAGLHLVARLDKHGFDNSGAFGADLV